MSHQCLFMLLGSTSVKAVRRTVAVNFINVSWAAFTRADPESPKAAYKTLMKLIPGVNFTNSLWADYLYETVLRSISLITVWLCNWQKNIYAKTAHKMFVKLTTGPAKTEMYTALDLLQFRKAETKQIWFQRCLCMATNSKS